MSVTNFAKKQFQKIEILTGRARPAVLAGNDILSGGGYLFVQKIHTRRKNCRTCHPGPSKTSDSYRCFSRSSGQTTKKNERIKTKARASCKRFCRSKGAYETFTFTPKK